MQFPGTPSQQNSWQSPPLIGGPPQGSGTFGQGSGAFGQGAGAFGQGGGGGAFPQTGQFPVGPRTPTSSTTQNSPAMTKIVSELSKLPESTLNYISGIIVTLSDPRNAPLLQLIRQFIPTSQSGSGQTQPPTTNGPVIGGPRPSSPQWQDQWSTPQWNGAQPSFGQGPRIPPNA